MNSAAVDRKGWQSEAKSLYKQGEKVTEIAAALKKSRKTVSEYINKLPDIDEIKKTRKEKSAERRKAYRQNWKKSNQDALDRALIKRQHDIDVLILSRDRCYE